MRPGCCIHFRGFQHETCASGIEWESTTPEPERSGSALRAPCWKTIGFDKPSAAQLAEHAKKGTCPHYREPTADELEQDRREIDAAVRRMMSATKLITEVKEEHAGNSWQGIKPCPVCGKNLHLSHSGYNGHVHGRCETPGCLNWME